MKQKLASSILHELRGHPVSMSFVNDHYTAHSDVNLKAYKTTQTHCGWTVECVVTTSVIPSGR